MMRQSEEMPRQSEEKLYEEKFSKEPTPEISISRVDLPPQTCEPPVPLPITNISHYEVKPQTECAPSINLVENVTKEVIEKTTNQNVVIIEKQLLEKEMSDPEIEPEPQPQPQSIEPELELEPEPVVESVPIPAPAPPTLELAPTPVPVPASAPVIEEIADPIVVPVIQELEVEKEITSVETPQPEQIEVVPEVKESIEVAEIESPPAVEQQETEPAPEC